MNSLKYHSTVEKCTTKPGKHSYCVFGEVW